MNKKPKIIRACTVPQSLGFVTGMIPDLQKEYEVVLLSSPGDEFWSPIREAHPDVKCIEVPMERHISPQKDLLVCRNNGSWLSLPKGPRHID